VPDWGGDAVVVPLVAGGTTLGWLGVLPRCRAFDAAQLVDAATAMAHAAVQRVTRPDEQPLVSALLGRPGGDLPPALRRASQVWVAAVQASAPIAPSVITGVLHLALRNTALPADAVFVVAADTAAYLVLGIAPSMTSRTLAGALEALLDAADSPRMHLRAAPSMAGDAATLPILREQADHAGAIPVRDCVCLRSETARPKMVLRNVITALDTLPDLGPDQLDSLLAYDRNRGSSLARTLIAWLDDHGDCSAASGRLGVHQNTFRYRLTAGTQAQPRGPGCPPLGAPTVTTRPNH
jgi:hypothetical protein